jgi:SIR2-like domain
MLMVIAGAGASFDSSPEYPTNTFPDIRPPLANQLFEKIGLRAEVRALYKQMDPLIPLLLTHHERTLEETLQQFQVESASNPVRAIQLAAVKCYLHTLFQRISATWLGQTSEITNYLSLFDRIAHYKQHATEPVCVVTFNYDLLIENALHRQFGAAFDSISDYVSHREAKLFKLHGSANWVRCISSMPQSVDATASKGPSATLQQMITCAASLNFSDQYNVEGQVFGPTFPAIAIPVVKKESFECPADHVGTLESMIPKVRKIIAIGWRGSEQRFLDMLAKGLSNTLQGVQALVVAGTAPEAMQTAEQLRGLGFGIKTECLAGFSTCIRDRKFDRLLSHKY